MATTAAIDFRANGEKWTIEKKVGARKDYGINVASRLSPGDTVAQGSIVAVGVGVTVDGPAFYATEALVDGKAVAGAYLMAWVMGGLEPDTSENYVEFSWATTAGRLDTQRIYFDVEF